MAECIHSLEQASCGICTPRRVSDPAAEYGVWFPAGFGSDCDGCGGRIEPGDQIRSDGEGGWLCTDCGDTGGGGGLHTIRPAGGIL